MGRRSTIRARDHDGNPCPWCNRIMDVSERSRQPTRDHLVPRCRDLTPLGYVQPPIIVIVCRQCNEDKGSLHIDQWIKRLREWDDPRFEIVRKWMRHNHGTVQRVRERERSHRPRPVKKRPRSGLTPHPDP